MMKRALPAGGTRKEPFLCRRGELTIRGTVFLPKDHSLPLPIAIVCHEFMMNRHFSYPYAKALAQQGYAAFCFDFCGGGLFSASDGDSREMSVLTEMEDLRAVIAYAQSLPYTDSASLLLMGCSQGGLVAAMTAVEYTAILRGLILQYPALSIPEEARKGEMLMLRFDPQNIPPRLRSGPFRLGRCYAADAMGLDPYKTITAYHGSVLLLHGDKDRIVAPHYSRQACRAYEEAGAAVQCKTISGAGHIFLRRRHRRQAIHHITAFVSSLC